MRQSRKRESRRGERQASRSGVSAQDRAGFIADMFRSCPDRSFTLKQLTSASGDASREGRYAVRDIVEALEREGVVERLGRDKYQLSTSQLPRYEGVVDMLASGAAYVKVEELENDIYINHRNTATPSTATVSRWRCSVRPARAGIPRVSSRQCWSAAASGMWVLPR